MNIQAVAPAPYPKPSFDDFRHAYEIDGRLIPGVTTTLSRISKPALIQWAANMACDYVKANHKPDCDLDALLKDAKYAHRKKKETAAESGMNIHAYAEAWFKGLPLPELKTDAAKKGSEAFHTWLEETKPEVKAAERICFSKQHFYAGTCDFVAVINGELCVGDIKTSSGIYPEMRLQTAAYQNALEEELNVQFAARYIVRFDKKTGKFEAKRFENYFADRDAFLACLSLHNALTKMESGSI